MIVISSLNLETAHAFAVSSGSHALRTYTNDARTPLVPPIETLRRYAARNPQAFMAPSENEGIEARASKFQRSMRTKLGLQSLLARCRARTNPW
jgi:hypothetical protein